MNHNIFDHTSVLKLIESVFGVAPLAARETSTDVGNLLSAIDLSRPPQSAPSLPLPSPVFPQKSLFKLYQPGNDPGYRPLSKRITTRSSFWLIIMQGWPTTQ